ncbi:CidA/LrgA family protein [Peptoniphilus sp. GNH]|nr:CidA/LrgA family protein [Peptoniphilus sp. GNH]
MKNLKGLTIIFLCLFLGDVCRKLIDFPIPGVIYGMFILLVLMLAKIVKLDDVESAAHLLLENLAFLFVPIAASLMNSMDILGEHLPKILIITIVSLFITMGVSAKVVELVQKLRGAKNG